MVRKSLVLVLFCISAIVSQMVHAEEWDDLNVLHVNTEQPHATMMTYPDSKLAFMGVREKSPWFQLLNGDWKFNWAENPAKRPSTFFETNFDDSSWETIPVPSNWQIHGYGTPIYTNIKYPHPNTPPKAPHKYNPVGSYRTTFTVPESFNGRRTIIHFDGVNSAFYLWINGKKVGYSQGSRTPAEFDITDYLKKGENLLAAEVYRWCDGSYIEDQDFWRLSGIFRDVYLWSRADQHIRDFEVDVDLDAQYQTATMEVKVESVKADACSVKAELIDANGKAVVSKSMPAGSQVLSFKFQVSSPVLWNAENPYLYKLLLTLDDKNGKTVEVIPWSVGFRKVEIKDGVFMINGVAVKMKGVNRHENEPNTGQCVTRAGMLKDVELFKKFNVNAVRTSHYPNDPFFYELCDKYGIYVLDEANIECHDARKLSNMPEWVEPNMDRVMRMAERDKNHACVVIWSLGNESGGGVAPAAMYKWLKANHSDRPVHCEYSNGDADMESKMYAGPGWGITGNRPNVLCEYTHAMGNSNGNLKEYWDAIYGSKVHMGGFVWDWVDQGIRQPVPEKFKDRIGVGPVKKDFFAYGGWWEAAKGLHNDDNFCMNGLVSSDRVPHPGLYAIKYVYRNIHVTAVDVAAGKFKVRNWFDFARISDFAEGTWVLQENGKSIADGMIPQLDVASHTEKEFSISIPKVEKVAGSEYLLTMSFTAKKGYSPLVPEGHELAWEQFVYAEATAPSITIGRKSELKVQDGTDSVKISGSSFELVFSKQEGMLKSFVSKGKSLIDRGFKPDFWRALTDNDNPSFKKFSDPKWKTAGQEWKAAESKVETLGDGSVRVLFTGALSAVQASCQLGYTVWGDGQVEVAMTCVPGAAAGEIKGPLRFGLEVLVPEEFELVEYYGRGPQPTYQDREFERVAIFDTTVDDMWVDYSEPQENGYRSDVRWVALRGKDKAGLLFIGDPRISFGAKHYAQEVIDNAKYSFQMERSKSIHLNIDLGQAGVGGNDSWGATPLNQYQLKNEPMSYKFRMMPIDGKTDVGAEFMKRQP